MESLQTGLELMVIGISVVFLVLFVLMYMMKWMSFLVKKWTKN